MSAVDTLIANLQQYETSTQSQPVICIIANLIAALQALESGGGTYQFNVRAITAAASPITLLNSDGYVDITNTSGGPLQVNMPVVPGTNQRIVVTDAGGNASANNFTIKAGSTTLDTINNNNGWSIPHWNATLNEWIVSG